MSVPSKIVEKEDGNRCFFFKKNQHSKCSCQKLQVYEFCYLNSGTPSAIRKQAYRLKQSKCNTVFFLTYCADLNRLLKVCKTCSTEEKSIRHVVSRLIFDFSGPVAKCYLLKSQAKTLYSSEIVRFNLFYSFKILPNVPR